MTVITQSPGQRMIAVRYGKVQHDPPLSPLSGQYVAPL